MITIRRIRNTVPLCSFLVILNICLLFSHTSSKACTLGVASGTATEDGRPLLWKTRDYEVKPNIIYYSQTDTISFISNITPEYGYDRSWYGVNEKGFAIANTFIPEIPKGDKGMGNGQFMHEALKSCTTIKDFISLLNQTNKLGRKTQATFGVIDAQGGAAIFEVMADSYQLFDANDKSVAPNGYIIRTNFTEGAGGNRGIERFNRSSQFIYSFHQGDSLGVNTILKYQMRDLNQTNTNIISGNYFLCNNNICRYASISATVIQGVKDKEPAYLTTMWSMLGNSFTSVATPYWPVGQTPEVSTGEENRFLYDVSSKIRKYIFNHPEKKYANLKNINYTKKLLFDLEDRILTQGMQQLDKWRNSSVTKQEMVSKQKEMAEKAYNGLNSIYKSLSQPSSSVITLKSFSDQGILNGDRKISISLPPGYSESDQNYRVMYFFDGEKAFCKGINESSKYSVNHYHDSLLAKGLIYPTIFVAVHNNKGLRGKNLTPTKDGNLDNMYKFIVEVLKPHIDKNYRTLKDKEFTGIAGSSLGGLASAWLACHHPETFGMAGVMSPSLWWDNNLLIKKVKSDNFKKFDSRIWVMSSDLNYPDMRANARIFAGILQEKGWVEDDDLAFYQVYDEYHGKKGCNKQMYDMLLFLLRKEQPQLERVNINSLKNAGTNSVNIEEQGEYACIFLEQWFTDGLRTTALYPKYVFKDKKVAKFKDEIFAQLLPIKVGKTQLSMNYKGLSASKAICSFNYNSYSKLKISKVASKVIIDGQLEDWDELSYKIENELKSECEKCQFDLKYDKNFVYLAIRVLDTNLITNPSNTRMRQDAINIYFDARPDPQRMLGRGRSDFNPFTRLRIFPQNKNNLELTKIGDFNRDHPKNTQIACSINSKGYQFEIAIPVSYLSKQQGKKWNDFRLNICHEDVDETNGKRISNWWKPNWKSKENYNGSGTFSINN